MPKHSNVWAKRRHLLRSTADMSEEFPDLLKAVRFAADRHRDQRRKGEDASPYINHPIEVAEVLARIGGVRDVAVLQAALLHDTIEDTTTTSDELEDEFGPRVRALVDEVTDDPALDRPARKRRQIETAPGLSDGAKQIRIADKICNIGDVVHAPPRGWSLERRQRYLEWTARVVHGCRGVNAALERHYDGLLRAGRAQLEAI